MIITKRLVIVLKKEDIEDDVHKAYQRANIEKTGFGVYIAGPSKTAKIG